jgi:hypothetical protein
VNVTFSTYLALQVQPWRWPCNGCSPPVYAMEFVPFLSQVYDNSGYDPSSTDCFTGCNANLYGDYLGDPVTGIEMTVAQFSSPMDYVSVGFTPGFGGWVQAFNAQNQLIDYASGAWGGGVLTLQNPNISSIAISSYLGLSQVQSISYGVPEPSAAVLFALGCLLLWAWKTK